MHDHVVRAGINSASANSIATHTAMRATTTTTTIRRAANGRQMDPAYRGALVACLKGRRYTTQ